MTGIPAERRSGEFRPSAATTSLAVDAGSAPDPHRGTVVAPVHLGCRRREHAECGQRVHARVQGHTQAPRLHHLAEGGRGVARLTVVEMQVQPRGRATEAAVAYPDVANGAGRLGQRVPYAGFLEQAARPGGNGVSAPIERRMLHRRQGRTIHHRRGDAGSSQSACQRPADRASADDAHLCRKPLRHGRTVALETHRRQAVAVPL